MSINHQWRALFALLAVAIVSLGLTACGGGDDDSDTTATGGGLIESNPDNGKVTLTVGSKNFTEEYVLGEIYAQALEAAGYKVKKQLNLGSETIALKALNTGDISGYPEYTSTALQTFFDFKPQDVPGDAQPAYEAAKAEFEKEGLTAFPPAPYSSANALGTLTSTAKKLDVTTISDLKGKSQDLALAGPSECRERVDCLVGFEDDYGLEFKSFTPIDPALRYQVLDKDEADLSILFTTDAQLFTDPDKYTLLADDKRVLTPGYPMFVTTQDVVKEAGPDFESTIVAVQQTLDLRTIRELNARVDVDKEQPSAVAEQYLKAAGYVK
jgi:glycine betaine/choline ABC-type transport system substrate-binding protein